MKTIRIALLSLIVGICFTLGNLAVVEYQTNSLKEKLSLTEKRISEHRKEIAEKKRELALFDLIGTASAASTIHVPDSMLYDAVRGQIVFGTDTIKCGLATSGYTYNRATHTKRSDVTPESSGTGYTAGGQTVTMTVTNDTTNHKLVLGIPQIVWSGATTIADAKYLYCYKSRGGAASADELVTVADFNEVKSSSGGTFTVQAITLEYTHF